MFSPFARQKRGEQASDTDGRFIRAVYRACLDREPDTGGFDAYLGQLRSGKLSWDDLIRGVLDSPEYRNKAAERRLKDPALAHLHECRRVVFQQFVPAADTVVDLGGAATDDPEGALFALGYPHAPRTLTIVDLPVEQRCEGKNQAPAERLRARRGTEVEYAYRSMTDLEFLKDASVDLVVAGQSIEHVTEPDADIVCRQVFRVLRPGGHFCLDTPNALLTRLQSPDHLIHPEHKREYRVEELCEKLRGCGFGIQSALGICAMPGSAKTGLFDYGEMTTGEPYCANPEFGYAMYLDAVKPPVSDA